MSSGRWKLFGNQQQERDFVVRGGMAWYKHILIAACEDVKTKSQEVRFTIDIDFKSRIINEGDSLYELIGYV